MTLKTIISYNKKDIKTEGSLEDLGNGYNTWIDLVSPEHVSAFWALYSQNDFF